MKDTEIRPGLLLVHGNQPEALRDLLLGWLQRHPLRALESETLVVQSNGVAQWLRLAFASDAGISAAQEFLLPSQLIWRAYRKLLGPEAVPEASPFDKPRLSWRLLRLLPALVERPEFGPLRRFLADDPDRRKAFQLAERLADLFDQYQVYRADWLQAWADGDAAWISAKGEREPLPDDQRWQALLWRELLDDVAADPLPEGSPSLVGSSRAAVHEAFIARARAWPAGSRPPGMPRRIVVFGVSALPAQWLEVLAELSRWAQVLVCVNNPCQHYWGDTVADRDWLRASRRHARRSGSPTELSADDLHLHSHPLLAAWGKQGRDFIGLLEAHDQDAQRAEFAARAGAIGLRIDLFDSRGDATLLQQLHDDILDLRPLRETRERWPAVDARADRSLRFHLAHSPQREVEVLHDLLLDALARDPTLNPRDIVVMAPDIDAYAPHVRAVFGLVGREDARHVPFSIADQGRRRTDPLLHAIELLLGLPASRFGVSDLLSLLEAPALARRFGLADDELPQLHRWIEGANIRWGLHSRQRESLGLPDSDAPAVPHSWLFGLRRMLLGYAVGDGQAWQGIEPYGEIGGLDAALLGPLVQLIERLEQTWRALSEPADVDAWCERLQRLLDDFFEADDDSDAYTLLQLSNALQRWQQIAQQARLADALPLSVVAEHWLAQVDDGGLNQRFFAGAVTFASLMPMRAIPFRQVYLLGMNDGDYPRSRAPLDFDLMGRDYRPGDRSRRHDDQYLFLEALLAARERLTISWVGRSAADNSERAPSVLVGQLRDHLAAGWRLLGSEADDKALLDALTVSHWLQPFNPRYFAASPAPDPAQRWFTYAHEWREAAAAGHRDPAAPAAQPELPALARDEPLTLAALAGFLKDPVRAFFQQRLGVHFDLAGSAALDLEPFELDGIERWTLQDELIRLQAAALEADASDDDAQVLLADRLQRMALRGDLPAGAFGRALVDELSEPMPDWRERWRKARASWPEPARDLALRWRAAGAQVEIADRIAGLRRSADGGLARLVLVSSDLVVKGQYRADKMIEPWVVHLAANCIEPLTTLAVGKVGSITLDPIAPDQAGEWLERIASAWQQGMRAPLPLPPKTAFAWLRASGDADRQAAAARSAYQGGYYNEGDLQRSPYLQRAFPDYDALVADGGFERLATGLLLPLLEALPVRSKKKAEGE